MFYIKIYFHLILICIATSAAYSQCTMVADVTPGEQGSSISFLSTTNNKIYFSARSTGTQFVLAPMEYSISTGLKEMQGADQYLFSGHSFTKFQDNIYFISADSIYGNQLWKFDGNKSERITNTIIDNAGFAAGGLCVFKNKLLFLGKIINQGYEIWEYDGVNPPLPITSFYNPEPTFEYPIILGDTLFFQGHGNSWGRRLWKYDGINHPIIVTPHDLTLYELTLFKNEIYFSALEMSSGIQLYKYKGVDNSQRITSFKTDNSSLSPRGFCTYKDEIYFGATTDTSGIVLWKYNVDNSTLSYLKNFSPGDNMSNVNEIKVYNDTLYLLANNSLWRFDGQTYKSIPLTNSINSYYCYGLQTTTEGVFFVAYHPIFGGELWKYPGTGEDIIIDPVVETQFVPNLITPNDDHLNDNFFIEGTNSNMELAIYNRWGTLVYKNYNYDNTWKAEGNPSGIYYYQLTNRDNEKKLTGWIQVVK